MSNAFWLCSCRHPQTKVYYADTALEVSYYRDILRRISEGVDNPKTLAEFALMWRDANIACAGIDPFAANPEGQR
jgi:hypothetical protein